MQLRVFLQATWWNRGKQKLETIKSTRGGRPMAKQMTRRGNEKFVKLSVEEGNIQNERDGCTQREREGETEWESR